MESITWENVAWRSESMPLEKINYIRKSSCETYDNAKENPSKETAVFLIETLKELEDHRGEKRPGVIAILKLAVDDTLILNRDYFEHFNY